MSSSAARSATTRNINFGVLLRRWRAVRRVSQLALVLDADISTRHLSCVETGRAQPSREMVLRLAEALEIPERRRFRLSFEAGRRRSIILNAMKSRALLPASLKVHAARKDVGSWET